jgi:hypothetical protein
MLTQLKGVYPIIFVSIIFPSSHLIQKYIYILETVLKLYSCFKPAAEILYISESNENWEKYSKQR